MIHLLLVASVMTHAQVAQAIETAPAPVRAFIQRRQGCNHWSGEEAYDQDRAKEIAAALRQLRCREIEADGTALRRRYVRQPEILDLLTRTVDWGEED